MMDHPVGCGTYAFLCKQRQALIRDFEKSDSCFVALSPEELEWRRQSENWTVEYLSNCRKVNAFVVRKSSDYEHECWVRWNYTGYRKAFANFLQQYYPEYRAVLNASVHVDHLEPQYRFPIGSNYFVRLHLVPKEINAAYGAGFERSFYRNERERKLHGAFLCLGWPSARRLANDRQRSPLVFSCGMLGRADRLANTVSILRSRRLGHMLGS